MYTKFGIVLGQSLSASVGLPSSLWYIWWPSRRLSSERGHACLSVAFALWMCFWVLPPGFSFEFCNYTKHTHTHTHTHMVIGTQFSFCGREFATLWNELGNPHTLWQFISHGKARLLREEEDLCWYSIWGHGCLWSVSNSSCVYIMGTWGLLSCQLSQKVGTLRLYVGHPVSAFRNCLSSWHIIFICEIKL